jgi:hypothetical protein
MFDGALQAFIFTILSVMYLAIVVNHITTHEGEDHLTDDARLGRIDMSTERGGGSV